MPARDASELVVECSQFSPSMRRAVIDIGTNSVKLLVADVAGADIQPVHETAEQTRLGRGFYESHILQPAELAHTAQAVASFAQQSRKLGAASLRVFATSAARDAKNPGDLLNAVDAACGLRVEIISGEQEAEWAFRGVTTDPALARQPLLLLDVGGGSTEFILGQGEHKHYRQSFPLGAVRLMEAIPHSDPPKPAELAATRAWLREFLAREIAPQLELALARERSQGSLLLVGTGGSASVLASMETGLGKFDRRKIEDTHLGAALVSKWVERLWSLPVAGRREIPGLPRKRADVMLTGAAIYEAAMGGLGFSELRITTRGLRFAAVMES
jgi:exopolyphosphatase/guanosine-5'-triphosphate,3'-diphosphate pyrophosphatase